MRYYGSHVSVAGGLPNAIKNATELQVNTIQIHPSAPQRWITKDIDTSLLDEFIERQQESGVKMMFSHGIYLINLANPDKQKFHLSKMSLVVYLNFMEAVRQAAEKSGSDLQVGGVVFHPGSAVHSPSMEEALERTIKGVNWILEHSDGGELLLEMSAGAGQVIGSKLEELAQIRAGAKDKSRVNYALDTQHMFATGYDWENKLEEVISEVDRVLGLENVKIIHLNDSKTELASKKDRHDNIGQGEIGESLRVAVNHPKLKDIPFVMETPALKDVKTAKEETKKLSEWIEKA